jgi:hypothetical protein
MVKAGISQSGYQEAGYQNIRESGFNIVVSISVHPVR